MRPLILTGAAGCGKSHFIQQEARRRGVALFVCPCRRDRTLKEGRPKLHQWGRRTEPAIIWVEGADDLTQEAQAFMRRILETHAPQVQFMLECRDSGKLQEPIRSRCDIRFIARPTLEELAVAPDIAEYLEEDERSYRQARLCAELKAECPELWAAVLKGRRGERAAAGGAGVPNAQGAQEAAMNPEVIIGRLCEDERIMRQWGECLEGAGSPWAFLAMATAGGAAPSAL